MTSFLLLALALAASVRAVPAEAPTVPTEQIFPVAAVKSHVFSSADASRGKRGVAYNNPDFVKHFDIPRSKVSWIYNWYSAPGDTRIWWEFSPMLHSNRPDHTGIWFQNVETCSKVYPPGKINVLSFNEPDQCGNGGACMQHIPTTVDEHRRWIEPLRSKYGDRLIVGSPAITNGVGDPANGNIMGLPYLKEFLKQCHGCQIDFVVIHWYDSARNPGYFKWHVEQVHRETGKPVWITEFGPSGTEHEQALFLTDVLPWLDAQPYVHRYSMFMASQGNLIKPDGTGLSELGVIYATY
ncbi:glycoside hydrolase family 128 protein [Sporormia fimetaria CBS 119925]|uniref:Glycoside hydrolase family 128 protein n=1 Tax=Sporormia fimetaria CBS 119925 TaxID=1340428 RepID=A0A6A6V1B8_9PLEO|nr:glycoside hydrolase family 128 protein [Sporormia fimetaria CBS 119925]